MALTPQPADKPEATGHANQPSPCLEGETESVTMTCMRQIAPAKTDSSSIDTYSRLRAMWVYRLYKERLQKYNWVRQMVRAGWGFAHPIYVRHLARWVSPVWRRQSWRSLVSFGGYVTRSGVETYTLVPGTVVDTPAPYTLPIREQRYLVAPHTEYSFPEITVARLSHAIIQGGTNLVFVDNQIVVHDLYDLLRDDMPEELHGKALLDLHGRRVKMRLNNIAPQSVPVAAVFTDACAPNYAHWMTEVLSRVAVFCADERFRGVPLVVDEGLHDNILESLFRVAGTDRDVITLASGCTLQVECLYLTSPAGYVPFGRRQGVAHGHSHGTFSPQAFSAIRRKILRQTPMEGAEIPSRKIYLRRNSGVRLVKNADEIEQLLKQRGFSVVEPEKLTFAQQAEMFAEASIIVGSSGAALANLVFAHPSTRIIIMIGKQPDTSYWYWQNMACALGNRVVYMLGEPEGTGGIHADFRVDAQELLLYLDKE